MSSRRDKTGAEIHLSWLALINGLLPILAINGCYLLAASVGHIPLCIPYIEGCTSISASGRYGLAFFVFKATIIPAAVLMCTYWWLCARWLRQLGEKSLQATQILTFLGTLAGFFLILYAIFLGSPGELYSFMRRFGVTVYFGCSGLAQLILLQRLRGLQEEVSPKFPDYVLPGQLAVGILMLGIGLLSIPVKNFVADADSVANAVEWNFALLLQSFYLLTWRLWRHTDFTANLTTNQD